MKKEKLRHYANVIASHADAPWVTPLFFFLFFIDSFLLLLPVDSLMAATLTMRPKHMKRWLFVSIVGFGLGLGVVAIIVNSQLQPYLFELFEKWGYFHHVEKVLSHAETYGYLELALGVFTIVPSLFGVLAGVVVNLNPWAVWAIAWVGKIIKILLTVWVIFSTSKAVKKVLKVYLKTSV